MTTSAYAATQQARLGPSNPIGFVTPTLAHLLAFADEDSYLVVRRTQYPPITGLNDTDPASRWQASLTTSSTKRASGRGPTPQDAINALELALVHLDPTAAKAAYDAVWAKIADAPMPLPPLRLSQQPPHSCYNPAYKTPCKSPGFFERLKDWWYGFIIPPEL